MPESRKSDKTVSRMSVGSRVKATSAGQAFHHSRLKLTPRRSSAASRGLPASVTDHSIFVASFPPTFVRVRCMYNTCHSLLLAAHEASQDLRDSRCWEAVKCNHESHGSRKQVWLYWPGPPTVYPTNRSVWNKWNHYGLGGRGIWVPIPTRARFLSSTRLPDGLCRASYSTPTLDFFPGGLSGRGLSWPTTHPRLVPWAGKRGLYIKCRIRLHDIEFN
jgi:hypothetical protein